MKFLHFLCFIFFSQVFFGQTSSWKFFDGFNIQNSSGILSNPWSGSFNNAQVNSIDLNFDGKEDLWVFDRVAQRSIVFRQENKQWKYDYSLEKTLPSISDWLQVADYDGDGRKDLFTSSPAGIKVLHNVSQNGKISFELLANPLMEEGFSGIVNLYVAATDIPVIQDLDGDGDLDILAFESAGHIIELHQNMSVENTGKPGLNLQKKSGCWGNLVYHDCSTIYLNQGCEIPGLKSKKLDLSPNKTMHSGNTLSAFSRNGFWDVWLGHVGCEHIAVAQNQGTATAPYFSSVQMVYPKENPIAVPFPATSFVDVDFDGKLDALVTPNASDNGSYQVDFKNSLIRLAQTNGNFEIKQYDFLQSTSLDVGENAAPLLLDVDKDGDLDLLVANAMGQVLFLEKKDQQFIFKTDDFGGIASLKPGNEMKLLLADWNRDGQNELYALTQTLKGPALFEYQFVQKQWIALNQGELLSNDQLISLDIDFDGLQENFVLHRSGQIDLVQIDRVENRIKILVRQADWGGFVGQNLNFQSFVVLDEYGSGQPIFYGVDKEGFIRKAIQENKQWKFMSIDEGLTNRFGQHVQIQSVDFDQDGKLDLILGTSGGGLMLFKNNGNSTIPELQEENLQVWPNPNQGDFFVRSTLEGVMNLFDLAGKFIKGNISIHSNETKRISLNLASKGVYVLQFMGASGKKEEKKILIGE